MKAEETKIKVYLFHEVIVLQQRQHKSSILMITQMKIKHNIIKNGHIFQIIYTEFNKQPARY